MSIEPSARPECEAVPGSGKPCEWRHDGCVRCNRERYPGGRHRYPAANVQPSDVMPEGRRWTLAATDNIHMPIGVLRGPFIDGTVEVMPVADHQEALRRSRSQARVDYEQAIRDARDAARAEAIEESTCVNCGALKAQIRNILKSLQRCATELEYVQAVEGNGHELCATGEGRSAADEAADIIAENRV